MRRRTPESAPDSVISADLRVSTAYAVRGEHGAALVDTGPAGREAALLDMVRRGGIGLEELRLVVITHCHPDHAGGAAEISQRLGIPTAVPRVEADWARIGRSQGYRPIRAFGHLLARVLPREFPAFAPDLLVDHGDRFDAHGVALTALHTPGHTPGSTSYLHRPSRHAYVGDLLAGSVLRENGPQLPYLADDTDQVLASTRDLLAAEPFRLFFGHGRPADALSALRRFGPITHPQETR